MRVPLFAFVVVAVLPPASAPVCAADEIPYLRPPKHVRADRPGEPAPMPRATQTAVCYPLRNVAAADAALAVRSFLDRTGQDVRLTFDAASNSVFVSATPEVQHHVLKLLGALDAQPPQVQIQALVVQVPQGFLSDVGLTDDSPGHPVLTLTPRELNVLHVQLRDAKGRGCLEVLSRPQLQVMDSQTGYVQIGANSPQLITSGATKVIEYQFVGVTLRVTPRVSPEGKVLMRVEPSVSTVSPTPIDLGNGTKAPAFHVQTVQTTVMASDGQTVVLRGLSVPHLRMNADDGALTALAKQAFEGKKCELLFVLTPHVVRASTPAVVPASDSRR
jgi:Flp pilus assembly secretin CpaC